MRLGWKSRKGDVQTASHEMLPLKHKQRRSVPLIPGVPPEADPCSGRNRCSLGAPGAARALDQMRNGEGKLYPSRASSVCIKLFVADPTQRLITFSFTTAGLARLT